MFHAKTADWKNNLVGAIKGVYCYWRTAATHVMVIMISTETCNKKPYALPVQWDLRMKVAGEFMQ